MGPVQMILRDDSRPKRQVGWGMTWPALAVNPVASLHAVCSSHSLSLLVGVCMGVWGGAHFCTAPMLHTQFHCIFSLLPSPHVLFTGIKKRIHPYTLKGARGCVKEAACQPASHFCDCVGLVVCTAPLRQVCANGIAPWASPCVVWIGY